MSQIMLKCSNRFMIERDWWIGRDPETYKLHRVYNGYAYFRGHKLTPGHLYLFPSSKSDDWQLGERYDHLFFDFSMIPLLTIRDMIDIDLAEYSEFGEISNAALGLLTWEKSKKDQLMTALLELILSMIDCIEPLNYIRDERIADAVRYICENYRNEIRLEELASQVNLNKFYFLNLFRNEMGITPLQYVHELRMQYAFMLLKQGRSISETADNIGFMSNSTFCTAFKRHFGMTPGKCARDG